MQKLNIKNNKTIIFGDAIKAILEQFRDLQNQGAIDSQQHTIQMQ